MSAPREPPSRRPVPHTGGPAAELVRHAGALLGRIARAFRLLTREQRMAALSAVGLFVALFLPWYKTTVVSGTPQRGHLPATVQTLTGWGAFSFVEAAVLLVAAGILTLLLHRAEGRAFHLPGGDGGVIAAAGFWACVLVVWRIFDKQSTTTQGNLVIGSGIEWGIFVALLVAAGLAWSGLLMRSAGVTEAPLPGSEAPTVVQTPFTREPTPTPVRAPASVSEQPTMPLRRDDRPR